MPAISTPFHRNGKHVVASAREAVRTLRFTYEAIAARTGGETALITIAALPSIVCTLLPSAIKSFTEEKPGVVIHVRDANQDKAVSLVMDGVADFAIVGKPASNPLLHFEELVTDRFHLVCREDHHLAKRDVVRWADLAQERFINLESTSSVRRYCDAALMHAGLAVNATYEIREIPSAAALVAAGLGVTALPEFTFSMFRFDGLSAVRLADPDFSRQIGVVRSLRRPMSSLYQIFVSHLRSATEKR